MCAYLRVNGILGFQYKNTNTDAAGVQVITDCNSSDFNGSSVALLAVEVSIMAILRQIYICVIIPAELVNHEERGVPIATLGTPIPLRNFREGEMR